MSQIYISIDRHCILPLSLYVQEHVDPVSLKRVQIKKDDGKLALN